jgi:hypothetical protein
MCIAQGGLVEGKELMMMRLRRLGRERPDARADGALYLHLASLGLIRGFQISSGRFLTYSTLNNIEIKLQTRCQLAILLSTASSHILVSLSYTMVYPSIDLTPYRESITEWIHIRRWTQEQVRRRLENYYNVKVSRSTLQRALLQWGIGSHTSKRNDMEALKERIREIFHELRLSDKETAEILEDDGYTASSRKVAAIRKDLGLLKRTPRHEVEHAEEVARSALVEQLAQGHIENFGRRHLYYYMRSKYNIIGR